MEEDLFSLATEAGHKTMGLNYHKGDLDFISDKVGLLWKQDNATSHLGKLWSVPHWGFSRSIHPRGARDSALCISTGGWIRYPCESSSSVKVHLTGIFIHHLVVKHHIVFRHNTKNIYFFKTSRDWWLFTLWTEAHINVGPQSWTQPMKLLLSPWGNALYFLSRSQKLAFWFLPFLKGEVNTSAHDWPFFLPPFRRMPPHTGNFHSSC